MMQLKTTGATRKKMSGKMNKQRTFNELFLKQVANQEELLRKGVYDRFMSDYTVDIPSDDVGLASYHVQQLVSEIGELLEADKRWKSHRNEKCDSIGKIEEIADCFIVLMNIAMFSGFDGLLLEDAIARKLDTVAARAERV